jgi:hypothetical protein
MGGMQWVKRHRLCKGDPDSCMVTVVDGEDSSSVFDQLTALGGRIIPRGNGRYQVTWPDGVDRSVCRLGRGGCSKGKRQSLPGGWAGSD